MAKSIPQVKIGNEIYDIKDKTAREHLIEVKEGNVPPTSPDNKLWIKGQDAEYLVPTYDEHNELKSALTLYTGNEEITNLTKNYYINTAGDTYSLTPVSNNSWSYMIVNASEGDKFTIKATGGGAARLWAFCNSDSGTGYDGNILTKAESSVSLDYGVIVAPEGTTKLIINVSNSATAEIYKGEFVVSDLNGLKEQLDDLGLEDEIITGDLIENQGVELSFANSGTMWNANGEIISNQYSTVYKAINGVISVQQGETYSFEGLRANQYDYGLLMFLDSNLKNGTQVSVTSNPFNYTVPSGKSKVCLTDYNSATTLENVKVMGPIKTGKFVLENLSLTEEQIDTIAERIPPDDSYKKFKGKKIVNFGDSIFGQARPPYDISTKLAELTGATVYNAGFGGCQMAYHATAAYNNFSMYKLADAIAATAEGASDAWDAQETAAAQSGMPAYFSETVAMLKAIDWTDIDIITISYGTNDFYNGLALLPLPDATPKNRAVDWALNYSIDKIQTAYPNIRIFVCLPMYRYFTIEQTDSNSITHTSWVDQQTRTFLAFVEAERNAAKDNQIPVLDTYYDLGINQYNWTHYIPASDGTHHNQTGRNLIAEFMADKMW